MKDYFHFLEEDKQATDEILSEKIEISKPKAFPGDKVIFNNPRTPAQGYAYGIVSGVSVHWIDADKYITRYLVHPEKKNYTVNVEEVEKFDGYITHPLV